MPDQNPRTIRVPTTGVDSVYYVSAPSPGELPYLYFDPPSGTDVGSSIVIDLPPELNGTVAVDVAPFHYDPANGVMTLDGTAVWAFTDTDAPIRSAIRTAYDSFMLALEQQGNVPAAWIRKIQAVIASCIPSTFAETLYFRYRLDARNRYVDLLPGMRLRLDHAAYQFVYPAADSGSGIQTSLNGMVGCGRDYLSLGSSLVGGTEAVLFDAYFGAVSTPSAPTEPDGAQGVANVLDLVGPTTLKPYYRLFYPTTLTSAAGPGSCGTQTNPTVVGTTTLEAMASATREYLSGQIVKPSATTWVGYWRGRTAVIPEISVFLQRNPTFVSVGTTIRQMYEPFTSLGRAAGQSLAANSVQRSPSAFVYTRRDYPRYQTVSTSPVRGVGSIPYADGIDGFDLPAWGGDSYAFLVANV